MSSITTQPIKHQQTTFNQATFVSTPVSTIMTAAARAFSGSTNENILLGSIITTSVSYLKSPYVIGGLSFVVLTALGLKVFSNQNRTIAQLEATIQSKENTIVDQQEQLTAKQTEKQEAKTATQLEEGSKDLRIKDLLAQIDQYKQEIKRLQPNSTFEPQSPYGTPATTLSTPKQSRKMRVDVSTPVKNDIAVAKQLSSAFDSDSDAE